MNALEALQNKTMKFSIIKEGKATISVPLVDAVSKKLPVFYNPAMTMNRDISILLLRALGRKDMRVADILAGSGVRAIRMLKELPASIVEHIHVNDSNPKFKSVMTKNLRLSDCPSKKLIVTTEDANVLMHGAGGFDYIDIDPFGSPAPFIDAAVRHLNRDGILALTATDTAALAGTARDACRRKYWAEPMRNHLMHEIGMRILARKAQLVAAQYDKALIPIYCHATLHYSRLYMVALKSKEAVSGVLDLHRNVVYNTRTAEFGIRDNETQEEHDILAGPLWTGPLWDADLAKKIAKLPQRDETARLTSMIAEEAKIPIIGFYDLHGLASGLKVDCPSFESIIKALRKQGHQAARSHFLQTGLKTDADITTLRKIIDD
jgi:tRNA (guanine26-N2/guanine27-N2)-dimethyltransferase